MSISRKRIISLWPSTIWNVSYLFLYSWVIFSSKYLFWKYSTLFQFKEFGLDIFSLRIEQFLSKKFYIVLTSGCCEPLFWWLIQFEIGPSYSKHLSIIICKMLFVSRDPLFVDNSMNRNDGKRRFYHPRHIFTHPFLFNCTTL